jgi:hypothetical protein
MTTIFVLYLQVMLKLPSETGGSAMSVLEIEVLHSLEGDRKKKIDTSTEAGRKEAQEFIRKQIREGTAIFLERGKKTYRIKDYDAKADKLIVSTDNGDTKASSAKGRKTAVPPKAGG